MLEHESSEFYKNLLMEIYPCKVPFTLRVLHTKPKTHCGMYYSASKHISINDKGRSVRQCTEIAIHEYAHHLHYTEFGKKEKKQAPHGREFWQIYGQLMGRAKELGHQTDLFAPVLVFPKNPERTSE